MGVGGLSGADASESAGNRIAKVIVGETGPMGTQPMLGVISEGFPEEVRLTMRSGLISQVRWNRGIPFCLTVWYETRKRNYTRELLSTHFLGVENPRPHFFPKTTATVAPYKILLCLHTANGKIKYGFLSPEAHQSNFHVKDRQNQITCVC